MRLKHLTTKLRGEKPSLETFINSESQRESMQHLAKQLKTEQFQWILSETQQRIVNQWEKSTDATERENLHSEQLALKRLTTVINGLAQKAQTK